MKPDCPFCSSRDCERISQFGGQIITAQWRCHACGSYFEALREDFDEPQPARLGGTVSTRSTTAPWW